MCAFSTKFALAGKWNSFAVKYLLRKCEIFADANMGKFHFTSTEGRYFTIHEVNYFTFDIAEYFTKNLPQQVADDIQGLHFDLLLKRGIYYFT